MKHYVLGFVFNKAKDKVLLVEKKRPEWQAGRWNGIGGKIEEGETPFDAMVREGMEETGYHGMGFIHCITFVCPGGTVFVFKGSSYGKNIPCIQKEDEQLAVWSINNMPADAFLMMNLKWLIPVCLSSIQFPILIQQNTLGVDRS